MNESASAVDSPPDVTDQGGTYVGADDEQQLELRHNGEVDWGTFESSAYWAHNYRSLRPDDRQIINIVGRFFSESLAADPRSGSLSGLDVGSGANLYPALSMLPFCRNVTLTDVAPTNYKWLHDATRGTGAGRSEATWPWRDFWREFAQYPGYREFPDAWGQLADPTRVAIEQIDVMNLPRAHWDLGTMFFVAESMTSYETEFEDATEHFLAALKPGAPFAAAFMDSSVGYVVNDKSFPAVREVNSAVVRQVLGDFGAQAEVIEIEVPELDPLRDGYKGMIVAVGTRAT